MSQASVARKLASAISPPQVYKILWKELNEEEGLWQVMPAEKKPHRASSAALTHLDELLDEALEQTFPASDAVAIDIDIERESHAWGTSSRFPHSARWQPEGRSEECTETLTLAPSDVDLQSPC
jgi:hypothetical protein